MKNNALRISNRGEFIRFLTSELPELPGYFSKDVEINRQGATSIDEIPDVPAMRPAQVGERQARGAIVLDTRPSEKFAAAHIPGSIQIGLQGQYAAWAGSILGLNTDVILLAEDVQRMEESRLRLARVGIERVVGYVADGIGGWVRDGLEVATTTRISVDQLYELAFRRQENIQVIDVRRPYEWRAGHVAVAITKPLNELAWTLSGIDPANPCAVYCQGGYRSSIACSLLQRAGFGQVMDVAGGFDSWLDHQLPYAVSERRPEMS